MSSTGQPQVAWIAIDAGAVVVAGDGSEIGRVKEVAGDEEHDIFDGLVVSHSRLRDDRYVPSERVKGIWPDRVETDLSPQEVEGMPAYRESKTTAWHADGGGLGTRLRLALRDLMGRRR